MKNYIFYKNGKLTGTGWNLQTNPALCFTKQFIYIGSFDLSIDEHN